MNIFYLDSDPQRCATQHVDKHVVKMVLEYAQLLSTAHRILDGTVRVMLSQSGRQKKVYWLSDERDSVLYTATHINHPSAIWTRQSKENYQWLFKLYVELMREYTHRYGKEHACGRLQTYLSACPQKIPQGVFSEPTPAMPDAYRVAGNAIASYRNYYLGDKCHLFSWKNRERPFWAV
jgi:hypothetical protein